MDDTRERFLNNIVARLGAERIVEVHVFSPIRQGVMETGVAVVAALPDLEPEPEAVNPEPGAEGSVDEADAAATEVPAEPAAADAEPSPYLAAEASAAEETVPAIETPQEARHVVFTARYRFTRKGPERGKWLFDLVAQADAPLATVDTVVRGARDRAKDLTETERLTGEQLRALMAEAVWRTAP